MKIQPSKRIALLKEYAFAEVDKEVSKLKSKGIDVIDFGVGDPKEETPLIIREACKKAVDKRKSFGYPSYVGEPEFRKAIAEWSGKRFNISLDPETEITSTIGAKEAVVNFANGFVNPGDYVLCLNPGYPPSSIGTKFAEGKPYFMNLLEENDFYPKFDEIPAEVLKKAKVMWLNYPNNPTTQIATKKFYKEAIDFAHDNDIIIASDEPYTENHYDEKPISILELDREGIAVFQSLSKRSNMTCYRVGWVAGDENVIKIFKKVKTNVDSGTATFIQDAAIAALKDEKHVEEMRKLYRQKRDMIIGALVDAGLPDCTPKATIYVWQKAPEGIDCVQLAKAFLKEDIGIVTTPGAWISENFMGINPGQSHVRLALVPTVEECKQAAERLKNLRL